MTRLAVVFFSAAILTALPYGSAGPACAKKYWQQPNCVEMCSGKWGYPGLMMGTGPWGTVIQKTAEDNWDTIIAEACGVSVSSSAVSAPAASASIAQAVGSSPSTYSVSSAVVSATQIASSSSVSSVLSSSAPASTFVASSSSTIASSSSTFVPPPPTSSTEEQQPSPTSTSVFTPSATSAVEQAAPTTSSTDAPAPAATTPTSSSSSSDSSDSSGSNGSDASDSDVQAYLSAHNTVRAQHGATALTWSNDAAAAAQKWANNCVFQHSGGTLGPFGENLAAGTGSSYGIPQAIESWASEVSQYNSADPVASHFTQMVWKATTQVGCAVASCSGIFAASFGLASYYVCEYSPQGNVIGEFAQNVQA